MAIALAKSYTRLLDEVYKAASVTSDLVTPPDLMQAGANAKEILYPQIVVGGLGDYDRASGYTTGAVDVAWKSATFNYDRGTKIQVDTQDDQETFNIAFGKASAELIRTRVAPESDAFAFASWAALSNISKVSSGVTYSDGAAFLTALLAAVNTMDEDEVPSEERYLFATPTLLNGIMALDTTKSREVLASFARAVKVPQSRFYTAIDMLDGKTAGEEAGHYTRAGEGVGAWEAATAYVLGDKVRGGNNVFECSTAGTSGAAAPTWSTAAPVADGAGNLKWTYVGPYGLDINFMIVHKPAVIKFDKHVASSIILPENNPDADGYIVKYRKYGLVDGYENKRAGIYLSHKA